MGGKTLLRVEAYMKGEENNAEKRSRDAKEKSSDHRHPNDDFRHNTSQKRGPPPSGGNNTPLTPPSLNQRREAILKEILHTRLIPETLPAKRQLGKDPQQSLQKKKLISDETQFPR